MTRGPPSSFVVREVFQVNTSIYGQPERETNKSADTSSSFLRRATTDFMTAEAYEFDFAFRRRLSTRVVNELMGVAP
jgi:GMP synthase PP-ATPase subunit